MTRTLSTLGWLFVVIDLIAAVTFFARRDVGDAATRGLGQGFGTILAGISLAAALLLWLGRTPERPVIVVILGCLVAVAPVALGVALTVSRQGVLALIYPSMRDRTPREPSPEYAYPDAAGHQAALALVRGDHAKLDSLLRATPPPDLAARDERGESLLGLAARAAVADGGTSAELEGVRLLLAAGARPRPDDLGREQALIELVAGATNGNAPVVLALFLDAGLSPDAPMNDGRSVLFNQWLSPAAARVLLSRGVDRSVHDTRGGAADWSPVTYQADLRNWATAMALLEGGVPRDHGSPVGSVLTRVLRVGDQDVTDQQRADATYRAFIAAVRP